MLDKGYESDQELEVLGEMTEGMRAFATRYKVSLSAKRDQASAMYHARSEGRAEGRVEIIRNLLANGVSMDVIYKSAGMSRAEIDAIIAQMQ